MLKVGITGGIGSGKTTACKVFETLGIPVYYADTEAKRIMVEDQVLIKGIIGAFGRESYTVDGTLNNKHIAGIVFKDKAELEKLNALVHPAVFRAFDNWVSSIKDKPYIVKEAALLFESGSYKMCDYNILVTSPMPVRLERVMLRDNATEEQVRARIDKQLSDEEKAKLADHIVINDESISLIAQLLDLHHKFTNNK